MLGRSGSGKTALCLREVRERLAADPEGPPLILLVPEQADVSDRVCAAAARRARRTR
ncbi:hypothetical protein ACFSL6_00060 [Paenibacillus thailandensis]|uniref:hypothetical protein n=1 Tax=Paenibacillus thailandensis TaxID=393250 RepID=UPI003632605D